MKEFLPTECGLSFDAILQLCRDNYNLWDRKACTFLSSDHWNISTPSIDRRLKLEVNICALMNSTYLRKTLKSYQPKHQNFTLVLRLISIFIINLLRHEVFSIMSLSVLFVLVFCFCSSETSDYAHNNCNFKEKLEKIQVIIRSNKSTTNIQYNV